MRKLLPLLLISLLVTLTKDNYSQCTVTTGTVSTLAFCPGSNITVPYTAVGAGCDPSTVNLYLSDAVGSFTSEVDITGPAFFIGSISGTIPLSTPAGTGYRVRVKVGPTYSGNDNGVDITVYALPTVLVSPSSITVCVGSTTNLTAAGATTYSWSPATYLNNTTGDIVTYTPITNVTTTYTITGTDGNGCTNKAYSSATGNNTGIGVNAGVNQNICEGNPVYLTATGATDYTWAPATYLNSSTGASVIANFPGSGSYTLTVTGNGGTCSGATDDVVITVSTGITVNAGTDVTICSGETTYLTASGGANYVWSPGTGLNATSGTIVAASPMASTNYTVSSTSGTCYSQDEVMITLATPPTITPSNDVTVCNGESVDFSVSLVSENNTYSWDPNFEGTTKTNDEDPNILILAVKPTVTGEFVITASNLYCNSTDTIYITVKEAPLITVSPSANITASAGTPVQLTASGASTYSWMPAIFLDVNSGPTVTFDSYSTPGIFTYTVTGTGLNGCTGYQAILITVTPGSGINGFDLAHSVNIAPNPYKESTQIRFTLSSFAYTQLEVYNMLGQKVQVLANEKLVAGEHKYNFSAKKIGQQAGIYFIRLSVDGKTSTARIAELE